MFNKLTTKLIAVLLMVIVLFGSNVSAHASISLDTTTHINHDLNDGRDKGECLDLGPGGIFGQNCDTANY
jgi:hypothetical protein